MTRDRILKVRLTEQEQIFLRSIAHSKGLPVASTLRTAALEQLLYHHISETKPNE